MLSVTTDKLLNVTADERPGKKERFGGHQVSRHCYSCGFAMGSDVENLIGVHVACVYRANQRTSATRIPAPSYATKR